jgi:hypothetical protein
VSRGSGELEGRTQPVPRLPARGWPTDSIRRLARPVRLGVALARSPRHPGRDRAAGTLATWDSETVMVDRRMNCVKGLPGLASLSAKRQTRNETSMSRNLESESRPAACQCQWRCRLTSSSTPPRRRRRTGVTTLTGASEGLEVWSSLTLPRVWRQGFHGPGSPDDQSSRAGSESESLSDGRLSPLTPLIVNLKYVAAFALRRIYGMVWDQWEILFGPSAAAQWAHQVGK